MLRHLVLFLVLCGFWALLSGQLDWSEPGQRYLMGCGVVSCALTTLLMWRVGFLEKEGNFIMIALKQPPYLLWLLWQIIVSNWDVAMRVWKPGLDIDPSIFDPNEKEVVEDLILAAIKDAQAKASERMEREMAKVTEGLGLPAGMKNPFGG